MIGLTPALRAARAPRTGVVAVLATGLVTRLLAVAMAPGGFGGLRGYDAGVYFAAADALVHGRVPYGGFTLLHPPGMMLALTPFAAAAHVVGDRAAYIAANTVFQVIGAATAAVVTVAARRHGAGRSAAVLGGLVAAVWWGAVSADASARLETLADLVLAVALLVLAARPRPAVVVAAGVLLGLLPTIKIWWVVPVAVVIGWQAVVHGRRHATGLLLAAVTATGAVCLPFLVRAPTAMWQMVVLDQLGRRRGRSVAARILALAGPGAGTRTITLPLVAVVLAAVAGCLVLAWRRRGGRPFVVLVLAQLAVLLAAPTYFGYYADFLTVPLALVVAFAGTAHGVRSRPRRLCPATVLAAVAAVAAVAFASGTAVPVSPFPHGARVRQAVAGKRCVMSDSPGAEALLGVLSRDLADGCPEWVDVSGRTYDADADHGLPRRRNPRWQRDVLRYLRSGDAVVLVRPASGLAPGTRSRVLSGRLLLRDGGLAVHATPTAPRPGTLLP